jgi:recombination protein RecT
MAQKTEVAETQKRPVTTAKDLREFLDKHIGTIREVAAKVISPERMVRIVVAAATKTPLLLKCDPLTTLRSCAKAAELGLEIEGGLGEAYLVPYWSSKRSTYEAQCIPGYRGLIKLARRSGEISKVEAHVVYTNDYFEFEHGTNEHLTHRPALDDRGEVAAFYAIAVLKDGAKQFEVMSHAQVEAIRKRSKAGTDGPWVTDPDEMGRKTVVRRLCKYLPMSVNLAQALELQAKTEAGDFEIDHEAVSRTVTQPIAAPDETRPPENGGGAGDPQQQGGAGDPPVEQTGQAMGDAKPAASAGKKISETNLKTIRKHLEAKSIPEDEFCHSFEIAKAEDLPAAKAGAATEWILKYEATQS